MIACVTRFYGLVELFLLPVMKMSYAVRGCSIILRFSLVAVLTLLAFAKVSPCIVVANLAC